MFQNVVWQSFMPNIVFSIFKNFNIVSSPCSQIDQLFFFSENLSSRNIDPT